MFTRESEMVKNLKVTRRTGMVKFASTLPVEEELEIDSSPAAKRVLNKFKKSPDIPKGYVQEHEEKLTKGEKPKEVVTQFFEGLQDVKAKNRLMIITAKLFRQHGIFKTAEKDVYQDLKTGDFWKISDDKKSVMRMFQEIDGVADRASDRHSVMQKAAQATDYKPAMFVQVILPDGKTYEAFRLKRKLLGGEWEIEDEKGAVVKAVEKNVAGQATRGKHSIVRNLAVNNWNDAKARAASSGSSKKIALNDDEEATTDEPWKPSEKEEAYFQKKDVERKKQKFQQPQSGF